MQYEVVNMIEGQPCFEVPLPVILSDLKIGGALETLSPLDYHTDQQRKWWKGILLPALAKDSGDTIDYWESRLKLAVLPDDFKPREYVLDGRIYEYIPSITTIGKKKMSLLISSSVARCHDWGFRWVTLPDIELKKL